MRLALLLLCMFCACAKKAPPARFTSVSAGYSCEFPSGWQVHEREGGAMAAAPDGASVSVTFFPKQDPQDFVKDHTRPGGPRKIDPGFVTAGTVAGLKSSEFTRELTEPSDMAHPNSPMISVKEAYSVIESKNGFYAIVYSAPAGVFERNMTSYGTLRDSFRLP